MTAATAAHPVYEEAAYMVTIPNGWQSLHRDRLSAIAYAARCRGTWEPLYRRIENARAPDGTPHQPGAS